MAMVNALPPGTIFSGFSISRMQLPSSPWPRSPGAMSALA